MRGLFKLGVVVELIERVTGPARRAIAAIANLEQAAKKAAAIAAMAGTIGMAGTAASQAAEQWRGAVFDILQPTVAVSESMAAMQTVTTSTMGSVQRSLAATKAAAIDWSKSHRDSVDQFLRTSYQMASAGLNDVQAIEGTRVALTVARATMADSAETANTLAILYNNLGDKTADVRTEMTRLGDILAKTQAMYQIANLGQLTEGLKYGTPAAVAFGTSVSELNVVLGALNSAGLQGGMAGTAYSAAMRQMLKASKELGFEIVRNADGGMSFVGTLESIRQKFGDTAAWSDDLRQRMQTAFGDEGLRAITLLVGKTGDLTRAWKEVAGAAGTAAEGQAAFESSLGGQAEILNNNLTMLKLQLAGSLIPLLNQLVPQLQELMNTFTRWSEAHPGLSRTIILGLALGAAILTIVAPILTATAGFLMMAAAGMQAGAWIARQFLSLGGIVGRAGDVVQTVQIRWLYAQDALRAGWTRVSTGARGAVSAMGRAATTIGRVSRTALTAAWTGLRSMATGLYQMGVQAIRTAITALPGLISATWAFTAALLANPITWIVLAIIALVAAIILLWRNWDKVTTWMGQAWERIKAAFAAGRDALMGVLSRITGFFRQYWVEILAVVFPFIGLPLLIVKHWDTIRAFFGNLWESIKTAALNGLTAIGEWVFAKLQGIYDWIVGLKDRFLAAGRGLFDSLTEGIKSAISKPVELVKGAVQKIRDLLPGSDAKEGPLSTLTRSGRALVTTFGGGMAQELPQLRNQFALGLDSVLDLPESAGETSPLLPAGFGPAPQITVNAPGSGRSERPIMIQRLILQVQQLSNANDLWAELRRLADEIEISEEGELA
ncbi:MAG: phage tail tape measure protein [Bacillota bacterium]